LQKIMRRISFFTYNIPTPTNIKNMFGNWLNEIDKETKDRIPIGVSIFCWLIWKCRNNIIFNKTDVSKENADYTYGYALDPLMGFPTLGGST
jgi:hypothetical protein